MKLDFSKIKLTELDGKEHENLDAKRTIANILYRKARNLDLIEVAEQINQGKEVEMRPGDIQELRGLIEDPSNGVFSFVRKATFDYLDEQEKK